MDGPTTTAIISLATLLAGAIAYAIKKRSDAERERAKAERIRAETDRQTAEDTGRVLVGAEADAATVRKWVDDLRGRLDRCERRHEGCEERVREVEAKCEAEHASKDAQIKALWRECGELRTSIESGGAR